MILNLSNRGLMLRAQVPLERGHIFELRRGCHVIVARVVWSDGYRCGARAQGLIPVADLVLDKAAKRGVFRSVERRTAPRLDQRADDSRRYGRAIEFFLAGASVACAAIFLADVMRDTFSASIAQVEAALGAR